MPPRPTVTLEFRPQNGDLFERSGDPQVLIADVGKVDRGIPNAGFRPIPSGCFVKIPSGVRLEVVSHLVAQRRGLYAFASSYTGPFEGEIIPVIANHAVATQRPKPGEPLARFTLHKEMVDIVMADPVTVAEVAVG